MNQQLFTVRAARKNLFEWDIVEYPGKERFVDADGLDEVCWEGQDQEAAATFDPMDLPDNKPVRNCNFEVQLESTASTVG